jgi:hypothetical protein
MERHAIDRFILGVDRKTPIPCPDLKEWAEWFERASQDGSRVLDKTDTENGTVSTVFLGVDHNFGSGPELLWETLVFGGSMDGETNRYPTWEEAQEGHSRMVNKVTGDLP